MCGVPTFILREGNPPTDLEDERGESELLNFGYHCAQDMISNRTTLRVARATDRLDEVVRFYVLGLGLDQLGSFVDHEGFDGVMVGKPDAPYHLEFTHQRGPSVGEAPTKENLLIFYLPDEGEWSAAINRMEAAGYAPVPSLNPYWDRHGRTFEDPDGYRVVLQNATWSS